MKKLPFIGYVVLTHGPRHSGKPLRERPGARVQVRAIEARVKEMGGAPLDIFSDHIRGRSGIGAYAVLWSVLERASRQPAPQPILVMDDIRRLMKHVNPVDMLAELEPHRHLVLDVRTNALLSEFSYQGYLALANAQLDNRVVERTAPDLTRAERTQQTERARDISRRARAHRAERAARPIAELRAELTDSGSAPSDRELARVANARGLKTSRGGDWSGRTIGRALARVEKHGGATGSGTSEPTDDDA